MDLARLETSWPMSKNNDQVTHLNKYAHDYASDSETALKILIATSKTVKSKRKSYNTIVY